MKSLMKASDRLVAKLVPSTEAVACCDCRWVTYCDNMFRKYRAWCGHWNCTAGSYDCGPGQFIGGC